MMSDSETNRPMNDEERLALYKQLMAERYPNATREQGSIQKTQDNPR